MADSKAKVFVVFESATESLFRGISYSRAEAAARIAAGENSVMVR
jgi:hypothetical protein